MKGPAKTWIDSESVAVKAYDSYRRAADLLERTKVAMGRTRRVSVTVCNANTSGVEEVGRDGRK
jgi:hypothetical protein